MSGNLLYAIGTLSTWLGFALGAWTVVRAVGALLDSRKTEGKGLGLIALVAIVAATALTFGSRLLGAGEPVQGARLPLIWCVMPFSAWVAVVSIAMVLVRAAQAFTQLTGSDRSARGRAAGIWAGLTVLFGILYWRGGEPIKMLRGEIDLSTGVAIAIGLVIVAGAAAMGLAARYAATRKWSRTAAAHLLLIAGCVVFGLPFAFLVVTSFKEDRDMASPNGIVWVPRVQQTVMYWDKKDPLLEGQYKGRAVSGTVISTLQDGQVEVGIIDPGAMRGLSFTSRRSELKEIPKQVPLVTASLDGRPIQGEVIEEMLDGSRRVLVTKPAELAGKEHIYKPGDVQPVREVGLQWRNYPDALAFMPPETNHGLVYLQNTLIIVVMSVIGTVLSSSIVAYAFARMRFPGRDLLFAILLATMMLPGAVTLLPKFLIFRGLGWIDTLYPLWVPAFFASAFNVFLLRQFFKSIPAELEDAARIDGCNPARTFWSIMLPMVKPALAVVIFLAFKDNWNNFMDPLVYIASPERMPLSYALQLFQGDRSSEPGMLMAFTTLTIVPVLLLFFFAQKYLVEGVSLSGLGGR